MKDYKTNLEIILDYIDKLNRYTEDINYEDFIENEEKYDACCMVLQQIGETASKIDKKEVDLSILPIDQMRGLRNRITHDYIGLDDDIIWDTLEISIPKLKNIINKYLSK